MDKKEKLLNVDGYANASVELQVDYLVDHYDEIECDIKCMKNKIFNEVVEALMNIGSFSQQDDLGTRVQTSGFSDMTPLLANARKLLNEYRQTEIITDEIEECLDIRAVSYIRSLERNVNLLAYHYELLTELLEKKYYDDMLPTMKNEVKFKDLKENQGYSPESINSKKSRNKRRIKEKMIDYLK